MLQVNIFYFYDIDSFQFSWERDWLYELFESTSEIKFNFIRFQENLIDITRPTILIFNHGVSQYLKYFQNQPYFVVHLSDEWLTDSVNFYDDRNCLHVFRCYMKPGYVNHPKVTYIPVGYKQEMFKCNENKCNENKCNENKCNENKCNETLVNDPHPVNVNDRKYLWSFVGCPNKNERQQILNSLANYQPNYIHLISYWNAPGSLDSQGMRNILEQSKIVPCLKGNVNIDTFRLYEALECGCIPIVYKYNDAFFGRDIEYFREMLGDHPIPTVENNDFAHVIQQLSSEKLEEKQQEIWQWYQKYKKELKSQICQIISTKSLE